MRGVSPSAAYPGLGAALEGLGDVSLGLARKTRFKLKKITLVNAYTTNQTKIDLTS